MTLLWWGGAGGLAAAVASARTGAKTVLVEREGCLGGGATTMMVNPFMPHSAPPAEPGADRKIVSAGIFAEVCRRLIDGGHAVDGVCIGFDDEYLKIELDRMLAEAGVDVLFHSALYDVVVRDGVVSSALFAHNLGPLEITGKVFVDGTGDGLLAARAGADIMFGDARGVVMPMTTKFVVGGVDTDRIPSIPDLKEMAAHGADDDPPLINTHISIYRVRPNGRVHFNAIRVPGHTLDPRGLSQAEAEGRRRVENYVTWLKAKAPGFENAYLEKMGAHIGVRESRRVVGDYLLTYEDWKACARFDDAIACCSYSIDVHQQEQGKTRLERLPPGGYYQIPYRCLTPRELGNVLVAARGISCDVEAHSSLRIMPTVMCIGHAAGVAAAQSLPSGDVRSVDTESLRDALRESGAVVD